MKISEKQIDAGIAAHNALRKKATRHDYDNRDAMRVIYLAMRQLEPEGEPPPIPNPRVRPGP